MANFNMDLTGTLPNYRETNNVFSVFRTEQFIDFGTPVFSSSVEVYLISGAVTTRLNEKDDYIIPDSAVTACDNDMSAAKLQNGDFDSQLTCGITMLRGVEAGTNYRIAVNYQRLYPSQIQEALIHGEAINFTPQLLAEILNKLEQLTIRTNQVTDVTAITTGNILLLELDNDETNENNVIEGEQHLVNVTGGRFLIRPKGGSFYKDSVTVYHPGSAATLKEGSDYYIIGMNQAKTKATTSIHPVYDFILLATPISDTVEVSYHAYGGDPTIDNYEQLLVSIQNIIQYLNESGSLTTSSLGSTEVVQNLIQRIEKLEADMRRLQGTPAYGDITSGKCILMKLFSERPGLHWYTIATLYNTNGSDMAPCTADTFVFRLQSQISHFQFTVAVSVDINNISGDRLNVNVVSENYPRGYTPFTDYETIDKIIKPQIRAVWNSQSTISGVMLQLGFELKGMMEETVAIEDMSGHESCWKLVEETAKATTPQDDLFLLPDGLSTWSSTNENSFAESMLVPFKNGHLIWAGSEPLNRPVDGWLYLDLNSEDLLLDTQTDIRRFTRLRLDIEEVEGLQFPVDICFNSGTTSLKGHASFTHQNEPVYVNAEMTQDEEDGSISLRLNWDVTAGATSNELDLKDLVVYC